MKMFKLRIFAFLLLGTFPTLAQTVVINEIMYHPAPAVPEQDGLEWVEIYNAGTNSINLNGWKFSKGVQFTLPNVSLAAGSFLVVSADTNAFKGRYPAVANVVGNWIGGGLGNNGKTIELQDAAGQTIDSVTYASQGDWALRQRGPNDIGHFGWQWFAEADGLGKSMELGNPRMLHDSGQNWFPSVSEGGTPGTANSQLTNDIAPLILEVAHFPVVPKSTNTVSVTARVLDESTAGIAVTLFYRLDANPQTSSFTAVTMLDNGASGEGLAGDYVYGATLPARPNNTVVEYYIQATDAAGHTRTWPAAARQTYSTLPQTDGTFAQTANALYQVINDFNYAGGQPLYQIVMTDVERVELDAIGRNSGGAANSDAAMNGSFVSMDGTGTEVRQVLGFRNRGHGSRTARPNNIRVEFSNDNRWKGVRSMNLNTRFTHAQVFGSALFQKSGLPMANSKPVQVRINGTTAGGGAPLYGSYAHNEELSSEFTDIHFPENSGGNVYRGIRIDSPLAYADLTYLGPDVSSCQGYPNCYTNLYFKQNNVSEWDFSDLIELTRVLSDASLTGTQYVSEVRRVFNVEDAMLYYALNTLVDNRETSLSNGNGDDYAMYRGTSDRRFNLLAYDTDTIMGEGDTAGSITAGLFRMNTGPSPGPMAKFMTHPDFVPIYYASLKRLIETTFSAAVLNPLIDRVLGDFVPAGTLTAMKTFQNSRNAFVLTQIPLTYSASSSLSQSAGYFYTTSPSAPVNGTANAIDTRSVLVNGLPATYNAVSGTWSVSGVPLNPGINRVQVQFLGTNNVEVSRATVDIWYDTGTSSNVSGTLASSTTWTSAGGPYLVSSSLVIPSGVTLTIAAGTTIYVAPSATITVNGTGRILAAGTETGHIRITRQPGVSGNWGSLDFIGATTESRLSYVDIDSCSGTTIGGHAAEIHVHNNSVIFLDHLVFANTPAVEYISFDGSSFIVQNSVFPTYPAATSGPEMLHGVNGIPAGGYGIFRSNYFGHTYGFNDTIDFTGGNRPGPVLQVIGNIFDGAGDDHLDLDSTDAWIEGNIFMHAHRDPNRTDNPLDTASAISGGVDFAGQYSEWTIINNLFYDLDHAVLNKQGGRFVFANNTLVHVNKENGGGLTSDIAAFDFTDDSLPLPDPSLGAGAYVANNIIWDVPQLFANYSPSNHTVIFENNILPMPWSGPGSNNVVVDPGLNLSLITNVLTADWKIVKAALTPRGGSAASGSGIGGVDRGGLNPRGLLVYGEPIGTTASTSATLNLFPGGTFNWGTSVPAYAWGYTHYKWKLDNGAWSAETSITAAPAINLSGLANGPHTVYVTGKNDAGYYQDDTFVYPTNSVIPAHVTASHTWTVNTSYAKLVLNEILARNDSSVVNGGSYPDVVELYNAGGSAVVLDGMGLTDDATQKFKYTFPAGTTLGTGQYRVIYGGNGGGGAPGLHFGFKLTATGGTLLLYAAGGSLVDSVSYGMQIPNLSIGRNLAGAWLLSQPTFGSANAAQPLADPNLLRVNEWLTSGQTLYPDDFVEIFNPSSLPVELSGMYVSDAPQTAPALSQLSNLSFIPAGGYVVLVADGKPEKGGDHLSFKLSPEQGQIALFTSSLALIDCILYGPQTIDVSEGRQPSGAATFAFFTTPTPGGPNPAGGVVVSNFSVTVMSMTNQWRYNASGANLGTAWRAVSYNDTVAGWTNGRAGFYHGDVPGSIPFTINTTLPFTSPNIQTNFYFRSGFNYTPGATPPSFMITHVIDDGVVIYLNGLEAYRYNMPGGTISATTFASSTIGTPGLVGAFPFPTTNLLAGTNVLAVEVHQATTTSSDIAMGIVIEDVKSVTNIFSTPIVLNEIMANNRSQQNADGTITDWVELLNPGGVTVDLSDMSLSDNVSQPRRWVVPAGISLAPNGHLVIRFDSLTLPSTNAGLVLNTGFGIKADGDQVYLFDSIARGGALVDSVTFGLQVADYTIGRVPNGRGRWVLTLPTAGSLNIQATLADGRNLKVNEWMASPASGSDWFEIYNPNNDPVSLGGLYLTDNLNNKFQFKIADLSFIGSGEDGFLEFQADNPPTFKGANHVNFKLDGAGEQIAISTGGGAVIDSIVFGPQTIGVSEGRFPDGSSNIVSFPGTPSPGESNLRPLLGVVINEALSHSTLPLEDAIELHNITQASIDMSGWYLTDKKSDPFRFRIPDGTIIQPGGYVVFYEYQLNPNQGIPPSFALSSSHGEDLYLFTADAAGNLTGFRTGVKFGAAADGVSFGAYQTSVGLNFTTLSQRTFGVDSPSTLAQFRSGTGLANAYPKVGPVVINEIHYHPPEIISGGVTNDNVLDEFVELYNFTANAVALFDPAFPTNHWKLRNAVDFDFPAGTSIPAGGYLVVVSFDPATNATQLNAFKSTFGVGAEVAIVGPYTIKLDNGNESIELARPDAPIAIGQPDSGFVPYYLVDKVEYGDRSPWPAAADGIGNSLQRRAASEYGNDPVNWMAGGPTPGAANTGSPVPVPIINNLTAPQTVPVGASITLAVSASGSNLGYQWRLNGALIPSATNASVSLGNVQATNAGVYQVLVSNVGGSAAASTAVTISLPPVIVQQPASKVAPNGGSIYLGVTVQGSAPLAYQWYKDGSALNGQIGASVVLTNLQALNEGSYRVVITNVYGAVTSAPASLSLNTAPFVAGQPQSTNVFVGGDVTFTAEVVGSQPLIYQWRFNNTNIPGASGTTLFLSNVQLANAGNYTLFAANNVGSVTSVVAVLTVTVPPAVTIVASDATAAEPGGNTGTFTISRSGSTSLPLTVNLSFTGTATPDADYVALPTAITIGAGQSSTNLIVVPIDDSLLEFPETVIGTVLSGSSYAVGNLASATVTILDNDNQTPSVTLTNPLPGAVFTTPVNLSLGAAASDVDGSIVKVEFYYGGTNKIGEATSPPYVITWTNAVAGTQSLTAVAYDNFDGVGVSAPVSVVLNSPPVVGFTSPTNGNFFFAPATVNLTVSATDSDGIVQVQFFAGTNLVATRTNAPYSMVQTNLAVGTYTFSASATDARGATAFAAPVTFTVGLPAPGFSDYFTNRGVLGGFSNYITGNNGAFSREIGEPKHDGKNGAHSGWIDWIAPVSGPVTMDTLGSGFDTVLAVYTGSDLSSLVLVASNDDASDSTLQSQVNFNAVAGVVYHIAVDGYSSTAFGSIVFTLNQSNPYPVITAQPQSQIINQGGTAFFSVTAVGQGSLRYQWVFNGTIIPNATNTTFTFNNAQASSEGVYTVTVTNLAGSAFSEAAVLTVRVPPVFSLQPQPVVVNPGSKALFTTTVSGSAPFTYQWRFIGGPIPGATGTNYSLANAQYTNGGLYSVSVANSAGTSISQGAELIVRPTIVSAVRTNGGWLLKINGTPGKQYGVEASANLVSWTTVGSITNTGVAAQFADPGPSTNSSLIYRLKVLP
ncbi:MAG: hypothetical protein JWM16_1978 [Verrucomicrobiales bacterium]|nr:hypothetical protein [Verrucomicrobiales bacterium]